MRVALDVSSTQSNHQFRGIGFYTERLHKELAKLTTSNSDFSLVPFSGNIPKADLYHYPAFSPFFMSFPLHLAKNTIITVHDLIPLEYSKYYPAGLRGTIKWRLQRHFLKYAKHIITDSETSKRSILKFTDVSKDRVSVVYLAADKIFEPVVENEVLKSVRDRYQLPEKFALYVGDMNWNKNIMKLARTCVAMEVPLVVVGKQAVAESIEVMHPWNTELVKFQLYAKQYPHLIKRLGFVKTPDLVALYNLATVLVHPAIVEGFGLTVLEAMQCRCPTIVGDRSSLPEIVGEAALQFNPSSQKDLEAAISKVWNNKTLRRKMADLGQKQAKKFSWEKTALGTLAVYRKVNT
ncbi:MAG: glycosyltransferase family 4 protein [Patescibacteria group bacterium]|jgi:glycosyltransferase involved in cell wall biosynthesis